MVCGGFDRSSLNWHSTGQVLRWQTLSPQWSSWCQGPVSLFVLFERSPCRVRYLSKISFRCWGAASLWKMLKVSKRISCLILWHIGKQCDWRSPGVMCVPVSTTYQPCRIIFYHLKLPQSLAMKSVQKCIGIVQSGQDESPHRGSTNVTIQLPPNPTDGSHVTVD